MGKREYKLVWGMYGNVCVEYPFDIWVMDWWVLVFVCKYLWYWVLKDMQPCCRNSIRKYQSNIINFVFNIKIISNGNS